MRTKRAWPQYYRDKQHRLQLHNIPAPLTIPAAEGRGPGLILGEMHTTNSHPHCPRQGFTPTFTFSSNGLVAKVSRSSPSPSKHNANCPWEARGRSTRERTACGMRVQEGRGLSPGAEGPWQKQNGKEAGNKLLPLLKASFQVLWISCFH